MAEKIYYSMGEVAEMFDVNPSLIRYWGTQFDSLRPKRNKEGNRLFTPEDVEQLKLIYHLVKERKMTLEGARKALRAERLVGSEGSVKVDLLERLQSVRSMLIEVRDSLGEGAAEESVEVVASTPQPQPVEPAEPQPYAILEEPVSENSESDEPRRIKFYEQTLF